jgi:plastocyanin
MLEAQSGAETTDPATLLVVPSSQDKTTQAQLSLQIYKQPDDVTVCVGDAATFSVTAFPEAATYQWRKDGTPISGETSASLTINPTSVADAGSYDVVVSYRSRSRTSTTAELSVNAGPVITTQPANQSAMVGDSVTFTVVADGVGPITYQWRKRQGVFGSTMTPIPGATASTYTIDPVSSGDSGTYDCLLTDGCGSKRTRRAILTVSF